MRPYSRRELLRGSLAFGTFVAGASILQACTPTSAPSALGTPAGGASPTGASPAESPRKGGILIEGGFADIRSFNTLNIADNPSLWITSMTSDALFELSPSGDLVPSLATSLPTPSADQLSYQVTLREAKWSDGQPITADDIVFSYGLISSPETRGFLSVYRSAIEPYLAGVEARDPKTVIFRLKRPWVPFLPTFGRLRFQPKHILGGISPEALNQHEFWSRPSVTSGPFKVVKWDKAQQVVLERNENFWNGPTLLDGYVMKLVSDVVVLGEQIKTGEMHVGQPDASQFGSFAGLNGITQKTVDLPGLTMYAFNLDPKHPNSRLFADKTVRKALQHALDRKRIAEAVYFGLADVGDSVVPPGLAFSNKDLESSYTYDKAKAEQLLDAAGWRRGADGIRTKDGVPFRFEILTNAGNKVRETTLVAMQQQWREIGIDATPRPIPSSQLAARFQTARDFDVQLRVLNFNTNDPDEVLNQYFSTRGADPGGLNGMAYRNPEVDKLLDEASLTTDTSKRKALYDEVQNILADELPAAVLVYQKSIWAISTKVEAWDVTPFNIAASRPWIKNVWLRP